MTTPRCTTRNCTSARFWRLINPTTQKPVYPELEPICTICHPPIGKKWKWETDWVEIVWAKQ